MSSKIEVTGFDSRGTADEPFGFLDFNDGMRIGYAPGAKGPNADGFFNPEQPYALRNKELRADHVSAAQVWVKEKLPAALEALRAHELAAASRKTYEFKVDGRTVYGNIDDYARRWSEEYYGAIALSSWVKELEGDGAALRVEVKEIGRDDDWADMLLSVNGETASVRVDLRS
jgi:hypothetical protein